MFHTIKITTLALATAVLATCQAPQRPANRAAVLAGDWDYDRAIGGSSSGSFDARRRWGYAHLTPDTRDAWIRRRTGDLISSVRRIRFTDEQSLILELDDDREIRARQVGETIVGKLYRHNVPVERVWFTRRASPPVFESPYQLWSGSVSAATYPIHIDQAVPMKTRDGVMLLNYVASPVGDGPFSVVLERTPYGRVNEAEARYWASRGYILVRQDVRGRGDSRGVDESNAHQREDGYDAVEWAARLPHSTGLVGMIGASDPGLYASAIAPVKATADPVRIAPYIDMVFSPTNIADACMMQGKKPRDISNLDVGAAMQHLPLAGLANDLGCSDQIVWDLWLRHPTFDAYWRDLSVEMHASRVRAPVLAVSAWYDDSRATPRHWVGLAAIVGHPFQRMVIGPGAHHGVDYVNGDFGPTARVDVRALELRWFDHFLKKVDNGVDREPPVDLFIMGDNRWRSETEWPLKRTVWTPYYLHSQGHANTSSGDGTLDTMPPTEELPDAYVYDPSNPTPYLIDSRELELSLNDDYAAVHATRPPDVLAYTTAPLTHEIEITGPITASLWAETDARDTDWNVMLLDVYPDGRALRVQDGVMRASDREALLRPGVVYRYSIDVWFTGLVVARGHRLRVVVSSAAFPKYDRNLNTGDNNEFGTQYVVAHQRVFHDRRHQSYVTLPIIPR